MARATFGQVMAKEKGVMTNQDKQRMQKPNQIKKVIETGKMMGQAVGKAMMGQNKGTQVGKQIRQHFKDPMLSWMR